LYSSVAPFFGLPHFDYRAIRFKVYAKEDFQLFELADVLAFMMANCFEKKDCCLIEPYETTPDLATVETFDATAAVAVRIDCMVVSFS
jgi:hypothetical protein